MNHITERAFKAWLEAEGVAIRIYTGLTGEEIPADDQIISCYAEGSEHVVGPLHKVKVKIILATPPHIDSNDDESAALDAHRDVLATLRDCVEKIDEGTAQLETVFNSTTGNTFSGGWMEGEDEAVDDARWVTTINYTCGVTLGG